MKIRVIYAHTDRTQDFFGSPDELRQDFLVNFGAFLPRGVDWRQAPLNSILHALARQEAFFVQVDQDGQAPEGQGDPNGQVGQAAAEMLGTGSRFERLLAAAKFLRGGGQPEPTTSVRNALWEADGDLVGAALVAWGLPQDHSGRQALTSVADALPGSLKKSVEYDSHTHVSADSGGQAMAEQVRRAIAAAALKPVDLGGRHSAGALIASDPNGGAILLKPGSGPQSPAAGARQDRSSQSEREAAFYSIAALVGLRDSLPECHMLLIDGREYAAMTLLGHRYRPAEKLLEARSDLLRYAIEGARTSGLLHKWAVLDFVLGNPDRHAGNMMINPNGEVKLIDHGSAFAGSEFNPAYDRSSFIPFYLRSTCPLTMPFNKLSPEDKVRLMSRAPEKVESAIVAWIDSINAEQLHNILHTSHIHSQASLDRLVKVKSIPRDQVSLGINRLWTAT